MNQKTSNTGSVEQSNLSPKEKFDRLIDEVYPHLNSLHNTRHSRKFWEILLYRYLSKVMIVDRAGLHDREIPTSVANDDTVFGPRVGEHETQKSRNHWNRGLSTTISRLLSRVPYASDDLREQVRILKLKFSPINSSRSALANFHSYNVISQIVTPPVSLLATSSTRNQVHRDNSKRIDLHHLTQSVDNPLARLALEWLPDWYVEEFHSRETGIQTIDPEKLEFHASFLTTIQSRFCIAKYVQEGTKLTIYQHAAMYGEVEQHLFHQVESHFADRFCTWGWKLLENDVPFLALRLMKPKSKAIRLNDTASLWVYVNVRQPFPWLIDLTLSIQDRFFSKLDERTTKNICIRPRVKKGGSWNHQICERAQQHIRVVDYGTSPWHNLANQSELVILDAFPSTIFMECISAGIPIIAIVPESTTFTEMAWEYYDRFLQFGILHSTPESAALFLNDLDVRSWWKSARSQEWFSSYLNLFCKTDLYNGSVVPGRS